MSDDLGPLFFEVHHDLPREGPGSDASTLRALEMIRAELPAAPRVVDVGCGPGAQTMALARGLPNAAITAFDLHAPFVEQLKRRASDEEVGGRVTPLVADMRTWAPEVPVDLVWCEGAAYLMGVGAALERWRGWLTPKGCLGFSEAVWLTDSPSEAAVDFWREYPSMGDRAACLAVVKDAGFAVVGDFVLPGRDWVDQYYAPLQTRLDALRTTYAGDEAALAELAMHQREIDVHQVHGDEYSYLFVVAQRR